MNLLLHAVHALHSPPLESGTRIDPKVVPSLVSSSRQIIDMRSHEREYIYIGLLEKLHRGHPFHQKWLLFQIPGIINI
jgi:hypothetical protein